MDAILQVVRKFNDSNVHHVSGSVNPQRDIEVINAELILADLETLEKRMGDNQKKMRAGDKEANARGPVYDKVKTALESGVLVRTMDLDEEEFEHLYDLHLLTNKPFIYAVNVDEDGINTSEAELRAITGVSDVKIPVLPICAKFELDMMGFSEDERKEFLAELGITKNPTDEVIKTCYDLLGLQYYFTAGEIEVRAWTIKKGWKAPQAAGVIHTDFERGFIKAEIMSFEDLRAAGSETAVREKGRLRIEGKEYVVQDGDIIHFRFNV